MFYFFVIYLILSHDLLLEGLYKKSKTILQTLLTGNLQLNITTLEVGDSRSFVIDLIASRFRAIVVRNDIYFH